MDYGGEEARYLQWVLLLLALLLHSVLLECCIEEERLALLEIQTYMKSFDNGIGNEQQWSFDSGGRKDCCKWSEVNCNITTGRVTELNLGSKVQQRFQLCGLFGNKNFISNDGIGLNDLFGKLNLDLSNNNLYADLPSKFLENNYNLITLSLANNSFTGGLHLPQSTIFSLNIFDISNSNFSDTLPEIIGKVYPNINHLNFSGNNFEGHIPSSIVKMRGIRNMDLSNNNFSGKLPRRMFSDYKFLEILDLSNNNLEGDIIPENMNLPNLNWLKASNNRFGGIISTSLQISSQLQYLDISNNNVNGQLPWWIGNFSSLVTLSVSQIKQFERPNSKGNLQNCNNLTGEIPSSLSNCSQLKILDLRDNQLSGGIPLWIDKLSSLTILLLAGNNLYGSIPQQLCQLRTNYLSYMDKNLVLMSGLDLSCNKLTGDIPPQLGDLTQIQSLNLSNNFLSGAIPSRFSKLQQIESLDLSHNNMSGTIPFQLVELNFLEIFNVSYNNLSGRVPETGQFASFDEFNYLSNPRLYGYYQVNGLHNPIRVLPPGIATVTQEGGDRAGIEMGDFVVSFSISTHDGVDQCLSMLIIIFSCGFRGH
ncbi:receptor-like protein 56 [Spinacia oleracea]|uniref:Receptor-like protein 56 n=1 Tax=Spinacia oleracea TaxID=3562 RepID=A0ABM3RSK7_SPIOL|nr:receptor-like protein 56 [Spinacia oleracea]